MVCEMGLEVFIGESCKKARERIRSEQMLGAGCESGEEHVRGDGNVPKVSKLVRSSKRIL